MDLDVNIVIVNYNLTEEIRRLIKSIYKNTYDIKFLINVVDNNSADRSIENLEKEFPEVNFYYLDKNYGFAVANNYILKKVKCKYHLVINPDTELIENSIKKLFEFMENHPEVGIAGPKIEYPDGKLQYSCLSFINPGYIISEILYFLGNYLRYELKIKEIFNKGEYIVTDYVLGAFMIIRDQVLEDIGYFDEDYFLFAEEGDLCKRVKKHKVAYWKGTTIIHSRSASTNKDKSQRVKWLYESKLLFIKKHYSFLYGGIIRFLIILLMMKNSIVKLRSDDVHRKKYLDTYKYIIKYYIKGVPVKNKLKL